MTSNTWVQHLYVYFLVWTIAFCLHYAVDSREEPVFLPGLEIQNVSPANVIAERDKDLILNCSVLYNPELGPLSIEWEKNGIPVDINKRIQLLENGSLYIKRIKYRPLKQKSDEGHYRCFATLKKVGTVILCDVHVQVAGIGKFDIEPKPQTVPVGGVAQFQCSVMAVPAASYIWQRNKSPLPYNNRTIILNSGILQIMGVTKADAGLYRCYATQMSGENYNFEDKYSTEAQLHVIDGSVQMKIIESSASVMTMPVGSPVLLECLVQGYHGKVQWQKDNRILPVQNSGRVVLLGTNLQFLQTEFTDEGNYQCKVGHLVINKRLNIIKKPIVKNITKSQRKPASSWIYVKCEVDSYPKASITWLKDGKDIIFSVSTNYQKSQDDVITIVRSELHNSGYYQCYASNEAGFASAFTRVEVFLQGEHICGPPVIFKAESVSSTQIDLEWQPPIPCLVLAYLVEIINDDSDEKLDDRVVKESGVNLQELVPFTNYLIIISTYTSKGSGTKSELRIRTKEDVPSKAPLVTLEPSAASILVKWDELPKHDQNGVVSEYKIFYRSIDNMIKTIDNIPGRAFSYVITDLEPETRYDVRILAGTSAGFPTLSDNQWPWVSIITESDNNVPAPSMTIIAISTTAVNISWSYPDVVSVKLFQIQVKLSGEVILNNTLSATARNMIYQGIDGSAIYEVALMVETVDGLKAKSVEEYSLSGMHMPPIPKNVKVVLRRARVMTIEWQVSDTGVVVTKYVVRVARYGASENATYITSEINSAVLVGLSPFTKYEISVRADGENIEGSYNSIIVEETSEEDASSTSPATNNPNVENQKLGIVIGISIGVLCIIICIIILRHRCILHGNREMPRTQPLHIHASGHIVSNCNGHALIARDIRTIDCGGYQLEAYIPMLDHLPENEHSDSKGGNRGSLIVTPNGAKLNKFVPLIKNGFKNGHLSTFVSNEYKPVGLNAEETRGLITAMLGGREPCLVSKVGEESFTDSHDDLCSLDNIDHSYDDIHYKSQVKEDNRSSSSLCTSDQNSTGYGSSSIPHSDTTEMGEIFVYPVSGQCLQSTSGDSSVEDDAVLLCHNIPQSNFQTSSSPEYTCDNGSTCEDMSHSLPSQELDPICGSSLPQGHCSTSNLSQAIGVKVFSRDNINPCNSFDARGNHEVDMVSGSTHMNVSVPDIPDVSPSVVCTGSPSGQPMQALPQRPPSATSAGITTETSFGSQCRHYHRDLLQQPVQALPQRPPSAASDGIPPQMMGNCVTPHPQGNDNGLSSADKNPNLTKLSPLAAREDTTC